MYGGRQPMGMIMGNNSPKQYVPRIPIPIRGGIKAQMRKSQKYHKPWAQKWIDYIESLSMGARLGRGRSYAISGQVYDLSISPGKISAKVQGANSNPYSCSLKWEAIDGKKKAKLVEMLKNSPLILSQLLINNLPGSVERYFRLAGYPLFPTIDDCILPSCNCPDGAANCKHIAALMLIVSEAFEQEPVNILSFRGISREDIFGKADAGPQRRRKEKVVLPDTTDGSFWGVRENKDFDYGTKPDKETAASPLAHRLGPVPFWRGEERFLDVVSEASSRSRAVAWQTWSGV